MGIDRHQLRDLVRRSCARRRLDSPAATELILLTCAQESDFGTFIRQKGGGPALGIFQMERPTFEWVHKTCIPKFAELGRIAFPMLEWDIDAAIFLCRLRYRIVPAPLPEESDILGLATYYKLHWNSTSGAATIEQAIDKYNKYAR